MEALRLGFSSIMYDCSTDSYENNVRRVARMVEIAHLFGATVEGELGHVGANETGSGDEGIYTQPSRPGTLWSAPGWTPWQWPSAPPTGPIRRSPSWTSAGSPRSPTPSPPPWSSTGAAACPTRTSGTAWQRHLQVNIFTDINCAAARAAHDGYREGCGLTDLQDGITQAVKEETMKKMRVFGSAGRG